MNNSFARLVDGMNATLRREVLPRLDDDFARGQVFGVINLLNTFKVRADWSAGFLMKQVDAQRAALREVEELAREAAAVARPPGIAFPPSASTDRDPQGAEVGALLAQRDAGNHAIGAWLRWLNAPPAGLTPGSVEAMEKALRDAMRAEVDLELRNSPRPLFAQMSSGRES